MLDSMGAAQDAAKKAAGKRPSTKVLIAFLFIVSYLLVTDCDITKKCGLLQLFPPNTRAIRQYPAKGNACPLVFPVPHRKKDTLRIVEQERPVKNLPVEKFTLGDFATASKMPACRKIKSPVFIGPSAPWHLALPQLSLVGTIAQMKYLPRSFQVASFHFFVRQTGITLRRNHRPARRQPFHFAHMHLHHMIIRCQTPLMQHIKFSIIV